MAARPPTIEEEEIEDEVEQADRNRRIDAERAEDAESIEPTAPTVVDADGDTIDLAVGDRIESLAPDYDRGTVASITATAIEIAWEGAACLLEHPVVAGEAQLGGGVLVFAASSREPDWREPWTDRSECYGD